MWSSSAYTSIPCSYDKEYKGNTSHFLKGRGGGTCAVVYGEILKSNMVDMYRWKNSHQLLENERVLDRDQHWRLR